jgi:hypothetical protein
MSWTVRTQGIKSSRPLSTPFPRVSSTFGDLTLNDQGN